MAGGNHGAVGGRSDATAPPYFAEAGIRHLQPYLHPFAKLAFWSRPECLLRYISTQTAEKFARKLVAARRDDPAIQNLIRLYLPAQERTNESKT